MNTAIKVHITGNILGLIAVCCILTSVFIEQLVFHDLPCPLCLLQRISYVAIGMCLVMNLRQGIKPSHYGLMLLATLLGLSIALKQVSLHMGPGDAGYGQPIFGLHLYAWAAISFASILALMAVALLFDSAFTQAITIEHKGLVFLIWVFFSLILINGISTFLECGAHICPANPIYYYFFTQ